MDKKCGSASMGKQQNTLKIISANLCRKHQQTDNIKQRKARTFHKLLMRNTRQLCT